VPRIDDIFAAAISAHVDTLKRSAESIARAAELMRTAVDRGGKILAFGNGGSAADSQHLASELVNRYCRERRPFAAIALTTDTSILTSIANDVSYARIFARQIEALGKPGDVAFGITTSGRSPNVLAGLEQARAQGLVTIALLGQDDRAVRSVSDLCIAVDAPSTPRVQEVHRTILHAVCELLES